MFSLTLREYIMIAHSLPHPFFGPAQGKHGATFTIDVTFYATKLDAHNVVVDIGKGLDVLKATLKPLNYQDLDTIPEFKGKLTTTEFLCHHIFECVKRAKNNGELGQDHLRLEALKVTLIENHLAQASYKAAL
jgi:6-pyruvoyl-tetrahydropterin synthase